MVFKTLVESILKLQRDPDNVLVLNAVSTLQNHLKHDLIQAFDSSRGLIDRHETLYRESSSFLDFLMKVCHIQLRRRDPPSENGSRRRDSRQNSGDRRQCTESNRDPPFDDSDQDADRLQRELQRCQTELRRATSRLEHLQESLNEKDGTVDRLRRDLDHCRMELEKMTWNPTTTTEKLDTVLDRLGSMSRSMSRLCKVTEDDRATITDLRKRLSACLQKNPKYAQTEAELIYECDSDKNSRDGGPSDRTLTKYNHSELQACKTELKNLKSSLRSLSAEYLDLELDDSSSSSTGTSDNTTIQLILLDLRLRLREYKELKEQLEDCTVEKKKRVDLLKNRTILLKKRRILLKKRRLQKGKSSALETEGDNVDGTSTCSSEDDSKIPDHGSCKSTLGDWEEWEKRGATIKAPFKKDHSKSEDSTKTVPKSELMDISEQESENRVHTENKTHILTLTDKIKSLELALEQCYKEKDEFIEMAKNLECRLQTLQKENAAHKAMLESYLKYIAVEYLDFDWLDPIGELDDFLKKLLRKLELYEKAKIESEEKLTDHLCDQKRFEKEMKLKNERIVDLERELKEQSSKTDDETHKTEREQITSLQKQLQKCKEEKESLELEKEKCATKLKKEKSNVASLQQKIKKLKTDYFPNTDTCKTELESEIMEVSQTELEDYKLKPNPNYVAELLRDSIFWRGELQKCQTERDELQRKNATLEQDVLSKVTEVVRLLQAINESQPMNLVLTQEILTKIEEIIGLKQNIIEFQLATPILAQDILAKIEEIIRLKQTILNGSQPMNEATAREILRKIDEIINLWQENEAIKVKLNKNEKEIITMHTLLQNDLKTESSQQNDDSPVGATKQESHHKAEEDFTQSDNSFEQQKEYHKQEIERINSELSDLKEKLTQCESDKLELNKQLQKYNIDIQELQKQLRECEDERLALKQRVKTYEKTLSDDSLRYQESRKSLDKLNALLERERDSLREKLKTVEAENSKKLLNNQAEILHLQETNSSRLQIIHQYKTLTDKLRSLVVDIGALSNDESIDPILAEIENFKLQIEQRNQQFSAEKQKIAEEYYELLQTKNTEMNTLRDQLMTMVQEKQTLTDFQSKAGHIFDHLQAQVRDLTERLQACEQSQQLHDQKYQSMIDEYHQKDVRLKIFDEQIYLLRTKAERIQVTDENFAQAVLDVLDRVPEHYTNLEEFALYYVNDLHEIQNVLNQLKKETGTISLRSYRDEVSEFVQNLRDESQLFKEENLTQSEWMKQFLAHYPTVAEYKNYQKIKTENEKLRLNDTHLREYFELEETVTRKSIGNKIDNLAIQYHIPKANLLDDPNFESHLSIYFENISKKQPAKRSNGSGPSGKEDTAPKIETGVSSQQKKRSIEPEEDVIVETCLKIPTRDETDDLSKQQPFKKRISVASGYSIGQSSSKDIATTRFDYSLTNIEILNLFAWFYQAFFDLKWKCLTETLPEEDMTRASRKLTVLETLDKKRKPNILVKILLDYVTIDMKHLTNVKPKLFEEKVSRDKFIEKIQKHMDKYIHTLVTHSVKRKETQSLENLSHPYPKRQDSNQSTSVTSSKSSAEESSTEEFRENRSRNVKKSQSLEDLVVADEPRRPRVHHRKVRKDLIVTAEGRASKREDRSRSPRKNT